MANSFYNATGYPAYGADGDSQSARSEFAAVQAAFDKMPTLTGNTIRIIRVNTAETALEAVTLNAALVPSTASGSIAATNTQNVIAELGARTIDGQAWSAGGVNLLVVAPATHAATDKATPVDADELPLVDSAAGFTLKKLTWANLKAAFYTALGGLIAAGTTKTTPVDADVITIGDSAAGNATKTLSWANLKVTLATWTGWTTQAQFNNSTNLATTAFVQRALGNFAGRIGADTTQTLPASVAGNVIVSNGTNPVLTVPVATTVPGGAAIVFEAISACSVARQGTDVFYGALSSTSIPLLAGDTLIIESNSITGWNVVGGSGQLQGAPGFTASKANAGYQKLPSGLIIQWASLDFTSNATQTWTLPIAFTTSVFTAYAIVEQNSGTINAVASWDASGKTLSTIKFQMTAATAVGVHVLAIGY